MPPLGDFCGWSQHIFQGQASEAATAFAQADGAPGTFTGIQPRSGMVS